MSLVAPDSLKGSTTFERLMQPVLITELDVPKRQECHGTSSST
jgi:hypothetical protein